MSISKPEVFDSNWAGPPELKPRVYRSQSEKDTWYAVAVENEYDLGILAPTDVVIDIGMNIGAFCDLAWRMGSRMVLGFEPSRFYFNAACENLAHRSGVYPHMAAIVRSDEPPGMSFHDGAMSTLVTTGDPVPSESLDNVIEAAGPVRFLKIDCEGAEWPILYTCTKLDRVKEISGEFHYDVKFFDPKLPPKRMESLAEFLRQRGFATWWKENAPGIGNFHAFKVKC